MRGLAAMGPIRHPINHAGMEVHMLIQAGATTKLQCRLTCTQVMSELNRCMKATAPICRAAPFALGHLRRTGAEGLQALFNDAQEDAQHPC